MQPHALLLSEVDLCPLLGRQVTAQDSLKRRLDRKEGRHAAGTGGVIKLGWENPKNHNQGFGLRVTIDHSNSVTDHYGHLASVSSKLLLGGRATTGQTIGGVERTGHVVGKVGVHPHYEFQHHGLAVIPTLHHDRRRSQSYTRTQRVVTVRPVREPH